jgi:DNA polymerase-2
VPGSFLTCDAFLLSKQGRDEKGRLVLDIWATSARGPLHITITGQEAVMFLERDVEAQAERRSAVSLRTLGGAAVDALYFRTQRALQKERDRLRAEGIYPSEADIKPVERYLMERFVTGGCTVSGNFRESRGVLCFQNPKIVACDYRPEFTVLSLDIETSGFEGPLLSIAGSSQREERVFVVGGAPSGEIPAHVTFHPDERATLLAFLGWVKALDPDLLIGWNVVDFDLDFLAQLGRRIGVPFSLGRGNARAEVLMPQTETQPKVARVPGRVVLDGIATLRSATLQFESYALGDVAREMLGREKDILKTGDSVEEIRRMARKDPLALARYNLEDCRLVLGIFKEARLVEFAVERARLTGLPMDRQGGSVAAFDQLYLPRLHRAGFVAKSVGDKDAQASSPGGYVMDSVPGLYRNVLVLDFKSLYPSIIRTFLIDPLGLAQPGSDPVPGFDGATFAREGHILPELIRSLWEARDSAKREKNAALSQAIKIMMNSFYGVLGTPGCRFFDHRLVSSITKRGHEILKSTRAFLERRSLFVLYGDTDSVFVLLDADLDPSECNRTGKALALELTAYFKDEFSRRYQIESHLELEYETHFERFFMPTMRGSEEGTKKRYAGLVDHGGGDRRIVVKGLEAVRTDWTPLARNFQRELFRLVFNDEPYHDYIVKTAQELASGKLDKELVYKKRIRRPLDEYVRNVPPHIQAARKAQARGRSIEYVITKNGPEPLGAVVSPLDYDHYLERQLGPVAESLLQCLREDFAAIVGPQLWLFPKAK